MLYHENVNEVTERVPGPEDPKLVEETDIEAKIYDVGECWRLGRVSADG